MLNSIRNNPAAPPAARNPVRNMPLPRIPAHILTSGQTNLSDDEFKEKIMEMARRDVAAGRNYRFVPNGCSAGTDEYRALKNEFISAASPDRAGMINNMLSGLANRLGRMMPRVNLGANLLTALMAHSRMFNSRDVGVNFINVRDASGNKIAIFNSDTGWSNVATPAKNGRAQEFFRLWDEAFVTIGEENWNTAVTIDLKKSGIAVDLTALKNKGSVVNMAKLAAAGITIDPETGRTVVNMPARGGTAHTNVHNGQEMNNSQIQEQIASRYAQNLSNQ